jgi:hypothetical protein
VRTLHILVDKLTVKFWVGSSYGWRDRGYRGDYYCDGRRWDRDGRCVSWRMSENSQAS